MERLKRYDLYLSYIIGSFVGVFISSSIYKYFDYKKYPKLYKIQSAPWYTSIQIYGLVTIIVTLIAIIFRFLIKKKLKGS